MNPAFSTFQSKPKHGQSACILLWLVWAMVLSVAANAQPMLEKQIIESFSCYSKFIGKKDGLSQGYVHDVQKDSRGKLWIATRDGLNRYDGYKFRVYRNEPGKPNSLPENNIHQLLPAENGDLWIGTHSMGIWYFDAQADAFFQVWKNEEDKSLLSMEYYKGKLWIAQLSNVVVLNFSRSDLRVPAAKAHPVFSLRDKRLSTDGSGMVPVWFPDKNELIVSGNDDSLLYYRSLGDSKKENLTVLSKQKLGLVAETGLCRFSTKWQTGLYIFGNQTISLVHLPSCQVVKQARYPDETRFGFQTTPYTDQKGNIWLNNLDGGFYIFDPADFSVKAFSDPWIRNVWGSAFYDDGIGNFWVGTNGFGLLQINLMSGHFNRFPGNYRLSWEDKAGNLKIPRNFAFPLNRGHGKQDLIPLSLVSSGSGSSILVEEGGQRTILIESGFDRSKVLSWYTGEGKKIREIPYKSDFEEAKGISHALFCRPNGRLWSCEYGKNWKKYLVCFDLPTGKQLHYNEFPMEGEIHELPFVSSHLVDRRGNFWLGTMAGVFCFDPNQRRWLQHFQTKEGDRSSILSNTVFSLCTDPENPDKYLWVGGRNGLTKVEMATGKGMRFTEAQGFAGNVVYGILPDEGGNLWMSTNKGISCFFPKDQSFRHFTAEDGLLGDEFNPYEYAKSANGMLYFGSGEGITGFQPAQLLKEKRRCRIGLNGFFVFNKEVDWKTSQILDAPIDRAHFIRLKHNESMFRIDFGISDFTSNDGKSYQYRLDGFDKQWIDAGNTNSATYTNLSPGRYTFRARGKNAGGIPSENEASIDIDVLPPWWQTWWFRLLSVVFLMASFYSFYRYRLHQELKILRLRDKIALDLHDEIGSSLNSIAFFGESAKRMIPGESEAVEVIDRINHKTREIMDSMSDIVWSLNTRNDQFENVLARLSSFAIYLMEPKDCEVIFESPQDLDGLQLDMEQRRNFYLLGKEAITNAAKYSRCTKLKIVFSLDKTSLKMEVMDNGTGFDPEKVKMGNGLLNMKKRAKDLGAQITIESSPGDGTRITVIRHV